MLYQMVGIGAFVERVLSALRAPIQLRVKPLPRRERLREINALNCIFMGLMVAFANGTPMGTIHENRKADIAGFFVRKMCFY